MNKRILPLVDTLQTQSLIAGPHSAKAEPAISDTKRHTPSYATPRNRIHSYE